MITEQQIEELAEQMAESDFEVSHDKTKLIIWKRTVMANGHVEKPNTDTIASSNWTIPAECAAADDMIVDAELQFIVRHNLEPADVDAVLARAQEISLENISRVAHAIGCPDGEPVISWSEAHGVSWRFKLPKPKITEQEIEELATKLADIHARDSDDDDGSTSAEGYALISHLEGDDLDAVLTRRERITTDRNIDEVFGGAEGKERMRTLERGQESLTRLLHATGCPDDEAMLPYLEERGVAFKDEDGWHFKLPKPGAVE